MMTQKRTPELLSPAGSLDKLKTAISYGADAVYLAGQKFGLRSAAENFTLAELAEGVEFARARMRKVYVVLNGFLHDQELAELPTFVRELSNLRVDGVIASDLGVISVVARESGLPIHLSTQASCLNVASGKLWRDLGVRRLILGREVSVREAGAIKRATGIEVELFIHGSMCMAYSGNCTISNFTRGRDSNRGGCAQSCRFEYSLDFSDGSRASNTFFMSSKDLMGLQQIPLFVEEGIDSVKIEGRMRSPLYAGLISKIYREALDVHAARGEFSREELSRWNEELAKIPHRAYMPGNLEGIAGADSVYHEDEHEKDTRPTFAFSGVVRAVESNRHILLEVRAGFERGAKLELVPFSGLPVQLSTDGLLSAIGTPIDSAKVNTLVRLPYLAGAQPGQIARRIS